MSPLSSCRYQPSRIWAGPVLWCSYSCKCGKTWRRPGRRWHRKHWQRVATLWRTARAIPSLYLWKFSPGNAPSVCILELCEKYQSELAGVSKFCFVGAVELVLVFCVQELVWKFGSGCSLDCSSVLGIQPVIDPSRAYTFLAWVVLIQIDVRHFLSETRSTRSSWSGSSYSNAKL